MNLNEINGTHCSNVNNSENTNANTDAMCNTNVYDHNPDCFLYNMCSNTSTKDEYDHDADLSVSNDEKSNIHVEMPDSTTVTCINNANFMKKPGRSSGNVFVKDNDVKPCMNQCGKCFRKVRPNDCFKSCDNSGLLFHDSCVDYKDNGTWWCRSCFTRTCLNELPFGDTYIDHDLFLGRGLKVAHLNIQSLGNKIDQVKLLLHCNNIDVFCVTETWLNDNFLIVM